MRRSLTVFLACVLSFLGSVIPSMAGEGASGLSAEEFFKVAAERARNRMEALSFDEFKATVYKEPFEGGVYIVNGDTPIPTEEGLREFFENNIKKTPELPGAKSFIVNTKKGEDTIWGPKKQHALTYCVSESFGAHHSQVVNAMKKAAAAWESVADVNFEHVPSQDKHCDPGNASVMFDVRPAANVSYFARSFFPKEERRFRNLLINETSLSLDPDGKLQLTGVLRHELGHTLGARHEHTRPEAGTCYEDSDWRPLTSYDAFSVMHYPECNGRGDWSLRLTDKDKFGAACLYGAAAGYSADLSGCPSQRKGADVSLVSICSYLGDAMPKAIKTMPASRSALDMIQKIVDASGLVQNFQVSAAAIPNAAAVTSGGVRRILYNPNFIDDLVKRTGSRWAPMSVLAHEIGHHLNGDTLANIGSRPQLEIEADSFSGFILERLGAPLKSATAVISLLATDNGSRSHPGRAQRLAAITSGWNKACKKDPDCFFDGADEPAPLAPRIGEESSTAGGELPFDEPCDPQLNDNCPRQEAPRSRANKAILFQP